jgi:hypothetical protein
MTIHCQGRPSNPLTEEVKTSDCRISTTTARLNQARRTRPQAHGRVRMSDDMARLKAYYSIIIIRHSRKTNRPSTGQEISWFFYAFENFEKRLIASSCVYVCLSACVNSVPTGRVPVKFYIGDLYENLSRNSKFERNQTKITDTLHTRLRILWPLWLLTSS